MATATPTHPPIGLIPEMDRVPEMGGACAMLRNALPFVLEIANTLTT